jgi:thiamine-phosphate pyrophosphorylase
MANDFRQRADFTPGVLRVLARAETYSAPENRQRLQPVPVLLGLLAESECRAATLLNRHGITIEKVLQRWGLLDIEVQIDEPITPIEIEPLDGLYRFSIELADSFRLATNWLVTSGLGGELATEHLLYGLVAADHELALWLREQGLAPEPLEREIATLYGNRLPDANGEALDIPEDDHPQTAGFDQPWEIDSSDAVLQETLGTTIGVLRAIDAAANRGREGLRVIEDYVRFALDDRFLTEELKVLRHEMTDALSQIPQSYRLAARETLTDVGTDVSLESELVRQDAQSVLSANFARWQEALRSLEEFGKLLDPEMAARFERIRYASYTLHRAIETTRVNLNRLASARLYALIDGQESSEIFDTLVEDLIVGGVDLIQLRDKRLGDRELLERARRLRMLTESTPTQFIMNDRPDLAILARADGVHIGQEELSIKEVRSLVGPKMLIGVSTHTIDQARQAVLESADYIGVGPTFESKTKKFDQFPGPQLLAAVAREIRLPAFAIGGITLENLDTVLETRIGRIAISSALTAQENITAVLVALREKLDKA